MSAVRQADPSPRKDGVHVGIPPPIPQMRSVCRNLPSAAALRKLGLLYEGTMRHTHVPLPAQRRVG